jgi:hypothetical protein
VCSNRLFAIAGLLLLCSAARAVEPADVLDSIRVRKQRLDAAVHTLMVEREYVPADTAAGRTRQTLFLSGTDARLELTPDSLRRANQVVIHQTGGTWTIRPESPKRRVERKEWALQRARWDWWSLIVDSSAVVGPDVVDGVKCWQLKCRDQDGLNSIRLWLDQRTLDCLKGECSDRRGLRWRWRHSDFRELASGVMIPYTTATFLKGAYVSTARLTRVDVNPPLKPDLFEIDQVKLKAESPRARKRRPE